VAWGPRGRDVVLALGAEDVSQPLLLLGVERGLAAEELRGLHLQTPYRGGSGRRSAGRTVQPGELYNRSARPSGLPECAKGLVIEGRMCVYDRLPTCPNARFGRCFGE
jgi:hypothetical protein